MRIFLSLFVAATLFYGCSQSGLNSSSQGGATTGGQGITGTSSSSSNRTTGPIRGISLKYAYPKVPDEDGNSLYYFTSFADSALQTSQNTLQSADPPREVRLDGFASGDTYAGDKYCFSNEQIKTSGAVNCKRTTTAVKDEISAYQKTPTGKQPVGISAFRMFLHTYAGDPNNNNKGKSQIVFHGAYIEKAPIVINRTTGEAVEPDEEDIIRLTYGKGCSLGSQSNTVGFETPGYLEKTHYMTGLWVYERARRKAFEVIDQDYEPHICQSGSTKWLCNLFAGKVTVWHAAFLPLLYTNGYVGHRQYPSEQLGEDNVVEGSPSAAETSFGLHASSALGSNVVQTPIFGKDREVRDGSGNITGYQTVPNWQKTFITRMCLWSERHEKDAAGADRTRPGIHAIRVETRSPFIKITR